MFCKAKIISSRDKTGVQSLCKRPSFTSPQLGSIGSKEWICDRLELFRNTIGGLKG